MKQILDWIHVWTLTIALKVFVALVFHSNKKRDGEDMQLMAYGRELNQGQLHEDCSLCICCACYTTEPLTRPF